MRKEIVFSETITTSVEPKRVFRLADECLLEIREVETKKVASTWIYEYEVKGEFGKIEKFLDRLKNIDMMDEQQ